MLHHQPFQAPINPQSHQQGLAPALSSRRGLAERSPCSGSSPAPKKIISAKSLTGRRGRVRTPTTNQEALEALKRSNDEAEKRALRDQLVRNNLPLVYAVTARLGHNLALPQEDLRQIGSLGLLRAIDAFEPSRGRTLSSFAVPYIRGAIQHELRDRASLMRVPRPLWELRRRATVLQDRRRRLGQPQLAPAQLAEALDCSTPQVVEALQVSAVVEMRSLDAPAGGEDSDASTGRTLLELLADPGSLSEALPEQTAEAPDGFIEALLSAEPLPASPGPAPGERASRQQAAPGELSPSAPADRRSQLVSRAQPPTGWPALTERSWLQRRLLKLTPQERQLLLGHVCLGRSWAELGRELQLHPRQAQRRTVALLSRLEAEAKRWRAGDADGSPQAPVAANGAAAVSQPAG